jgi:hypothetical protein
MNRFGKALLAGATALITVGTATGTAHARTSASMAADLKCTYKFDSLTATDLWHYSGKDWIWFVIDGTYYPGNNRSIPFFEGTTQTAGTFNDPAREQTFGLNVTFQVVLDRTWPTANVVIDSNTVNCPVGQNRSLRFSDGDATYDLVYDVTQH